MVEGGSAWPDTLGLLAVAALLGSDSGSGYPTETQVRRSISTSYYAAFHALVSRCAAILGHGEADVGRSVARVIEHRTLVNAAMWIVEGRVVGRSPHVRMAGQPLVAEAAADRAVVAAASAFCNLQDARMIADYGKMVKADQAVAEYFHGGAVEVIDVVSSESPAMRRVVDAWCRLVWVAR